MVPTWRVEVALNEVAATKNVPLPQGVATLKELVFLRSEWRIAARRNIRARATIKQAQMERAWPMLGHLDIYSWPS